MALNDNLFHSTVNIERYSTSGVDARGNLTSDWATHQTNVNCKIISNGTAEDRDGRNTIIESITIYFDDTVDVLAKDRVKDGIKFYEITGVNTRTDAKGELCYTIIDCLYRE